MNPDELPLSALLSISNNPQLERMSTEELTELVRKLRAAAVPAALDGRLKTEEKPLSEAELRRRLLDAI